MLRMPIRTRLLRGLMRYLRDRSGGKFLDVCGIRVYTPPELPVPAVAEKKLTEAIRLLFDVDARWGRFLAAHRIVLEIVPSYWARYDRGLNAIQFGERALVEYSVEQITRDLVAEATRARLMRHIAISRKNVERIYRVMLIQEMGFLRAVATRPAVDVAADLRWWRARWDHPVSSREAERGRVIDLLQGMGAPVWLLRLVAWVPVPRYALESSDGQTRSASH